MALHQICVFPDEGNLPVWAHYKNPLNNPQQFHPVQLTTRLVQQLMTSLFLTLIALL